MSVFGKFTSKITGKVSALRTIAEKANKLKNMYKDRFDHINSLMDSIVNILLSVIGYDELIEVIESIISENIENIEELVKSSIKIILKNVISCGVEPTITKELIDSGFTFEVPNLDPLSLLATSPTSKEGKYVYFEPEKGVNSSDFNVFLYEVIRRSVNSSSYGGETWFSTNDEGEKTPLLNVSFSEYDLGSCKSNVVRIKVASRYSGIKLNTFISDFLDSFKLYNGTQILSYIIDNLIGSNILNKNKSQILIEKEIENLVNKILNTVDSETVIDDSFYQFSNDTYDRLYEETLSKKRDGYVLNGNVIEITDFDKIFNIEDSTLNEKQIKNVNSVINNITQELLDKQEINKTETTNFKNNIIEKIITSLTTAITTIIFSPKVLLLFQMVNKLYGFEDSFDIKSFFKENINLIKMIIINVRDIIIKKLIDKLKSEITPLISKVVLELTKEKMLIYKTQLKNLIKSKIKI